MSTHYLMYVFLFAHSISRGNAYHIIMPILGLKEGMIMLRYALVMVHSIGEC